MSRWTKSRAGLRRRQGSRAVGASLLAMLLLASACSGGDEAPTDDASSEAAADSGGDATDGDQSGDVAEEPSTEDAAAGGGGDEPVVIGWSETPTSLDAAKAQGQMDATTLENIYDSLMKRAPDGSAEPSIAESYEYSDDGLELTLNIRQGVMFHNGEELTAEDVVYSLDRLRDPEFPGQYADRHLHIADVEAVDDYTVLVTNETAFPTWMHNAPVYTPIVPKSVGEELGYDGFGVDPETAVGTGPYRVTEYVRDDRVVLEAFEDHWRGAPDIKEVVVRSMPDDSSRTAALLSGDIDIAQNFPLEQQSAVEGTEGVEVRTAESAARVRLTLNAEEGPFSDVRVREAAALALDLQSIIDNVLEGSGELIPIYTLPTEVGFNEELEPYGYDPERARELLAEAGHEDGIQGVRLYGRTREPKAEEVAQAIQAMLAEVGIQADLQVVGDDDYARINEENALDMGIAAHRGGATFHAQFGLNSIFHCEDGSSTWRGFYCNDEVEDLFAEALETEVTDPEAAMDIYREIQEILHEEYVFAGAWAQPWIFGVNSDLNWDPHPDGGNWMYRASWN